MVGLAGRALVTYLERRTQASFLSRKKTAERRAADEALRELDRLDALLANLRPVTTPARPAPAESAAVSGTR